VTATVNATSLAYLPMALIGRQHTINGMYYIMSTELVYKYDVFTNIEGALSDEYALAKLLSDKGVTIKQNISPCLCKTTVKSAREYFALLKRWSIFAKIYAKENAGFHLLALVAAPLFLPFIALAPLLISQSRDLLILFALIYISKVAINTLLHHLVYGNAQNPLAALPLEFIADMLYPIHYLRAIFGSNKISWRGKEIEHR
jgi:ceramide glucosyltransferase